jgi:site-specific recombinase XerD
LLRAQVAFKTIGDLLGHRSPASTGTYLKLATDDLRSVALEVPGGTR